MKYTVNNIEYRLVAHSHLGCISVWDWGTKAKAEDLQKAAKALFPKAAYSIQSRPKKDLATKRARSTKR